MISGGTTSRFFSMRSLWQWKGLSDSFCSWLHGYFKIAWGYIPHTMSFRSPWVPSCIYSYGSSAQYRRFIPEYLLNDGVRLVCYEYRMPIKFGHMQHSLDPKKERMVALIQRIRNSGLVAKYQISTFYRKFEYSFRTSASPLWSFP